VAQGGGAKRRQQAMHRRVAELVGVGRNRRSEGVFVRGKAEKREHETGNSFRGFGRDAGARGRQTAARRGMVAIVNDCVREEAV
jgi:hypothetical protein